MAKHRANGHRWPGMLQSSKDRAKPVRTGFAGKFRFPGGDPLVVMKWRDIFDSLESAADRCDDVANIVEGVVLEYA